MAKTKSRTDKLTDFLLGDHPKFFAIKTLPLEFLSPETKTVLTSLLGQDDQGKLDKALLDIKPLQSLWKKLIIDSIHFLRINDFRERAFFVDSVSKEKTKMTTDGSDRAAISNAYGIKELNDYFEQFTEFEALLYGSDRFYRDHVQHPIKVWLIGMHILDKFGEQFACRTANSFKIEKADFANPEWAQFKEKKEGKGEEIQRISTAELMAMWTIAALTHDLGYPLEKVEKINEQLEKMVRHFGNVGFTKSKVNFQTQHDHLVKFLIKIMSSNVHLNSKETSIHKDSCWYTHVRPKYASKFSKSWQHFDHGFVSSLILLRSLTFFIETDASTDQIVFLSSEDARQFVIRSEILHTIAAHTTPKVYHLTANTLPFLLVLCDELQEWGRPTMADLRHGKIKGDLVEAVRIKTCHISPKQSEIECEIEYGEKETYKNQEQIARRVFQSWHEKLRPAVDDEKRKMKFKWTLKFPDSSLPWEFSLDSNGQVFKQFVFKGPTEADKSTGADHSLYQ